MLHISEPALILLKEALVKERVIDGQVFRLDVKQERLVVNLMEPQRGDIRFNQDGETVLAAPRKVAKAMLDDTTIDLARAKRGQALVVRHPLAESQV